MHYDTALSEERSPDALRWNELSALYDLYTGTNPHWRRRLPFIELPRTASTLGNKSASFFLCPILIRYGLDFRTKRKNYQKSCKMLQIVIYSENVEYAVI